MLLMTLFVSGFIQAQNNYFALYPNAVDVQGSSPSTSSISGASSSAYAVGNAAYDENGDVLFYFVDRYMYDGNGVYRGLLPDMSTYGSMQGEIAIVPVEGECRKYHVIYAMFTVYDAGVINVIVDVSSGTPQIQALPGGYTELSTSSTDGCGIAVSKKDGNGDRKMYIIQHPNLIEFDIEGDDITCVGNLETTFYFAGGITEMDLSDDGSTLVFADKYDPKVHTYDIPTNTLNTVNIGSGSHVVGVEFFPGSTEELYASVFGHGIVAVDMSLGGSFSGSLSSACDRTLLETGSSGLIYGVNSSGKLFSINPTNNTISTSTITCNSNNGASHTAGIYTMNDQIDGENYDYFNGVSPVSISATVNGEGFQGTYSGTWIEVYNCVSIPMVSTISGEEYKIELYQSDATGALGSSIYSSGWVSGTPSSPLDLRYLTGTNGDWLSNHTGYFILKITLSNNCDADVTETAFVCVNAAPTAATVDLQINKANNNGVPVAVDQTLPGVSLGLYSGSYNISNSSGDIEYYEVKVEEVDCSTGAVIETIYPATEIALTQSIGQLTALALNQLTVPDNDTYGWEENQGFFAQKGYNMCLKLTVGVGNVCGKSSDWSYVKLDCFCKQGMTAQSTGEFEVAPYPNPVKSSVNFPISSESLIIKDISGDIVAIDAQQGNGVTSINTEGLAAGIYFYEIELDGQRYNGKFVKQ